MNADLRRRAPRLALAALPLLLGACDWFTEFKSQPRIEPWEPTSQRDDDTTHAPRGNPQFSVPISGTYAAGYQISRLPAIGVIDSFSTIANPTPVSPASLANGRKYYTINCSVCHGLGGQGDGPAVKYGMAGINLTMDMTKSRTDGYIYGMIRNGRGLMPTYNRIEELDRWDVVNYVRVLQGTVPNSTGGTAPYGYPGQNGATVPGASHTAPTLPPPMWRPTAAAAAQAMSAPALGAPGDTASGLTARPGAATDSAARTAQPRRTP